MNKETLWRGWIPFRLVYFNVVKSILVMGAFSLLIHLRLFICGFNRLVSFLIQIPLLPWFNHGFNWTLLSSLLIPYFSSILLLYWLNSTFDFSWIHPQLKSYHLGHGLGQIFGLSEILDWSLFPPWHATSPWILPHWASHTNDFLSHD